MLFILVMEVLSGMMNNIVLEGHIKRFNATVGAVGTFACHLLFADDTL